MAASAPMEPDIPLRAWAASQNPFTFFISAASSISRILFSLSRMKIHTRFFTKSFVGPSASISPIVASSIPGRIFFSAGFGRERSSPAIAGRSPPCDVRVCSRERTFFVSNGLVM
jgi:hypothetical protein